MGQAIPKSSCLRLLFVLTSLCLTFIAVVTGQKGEVRRFPQESADLLSPRGDKSLHWEPPGNNGELHRVYLIDLATKKSIEVSSFSRHVSVGWAPTGRALFVTDYSGSDSSRCMAFVVNDQPLQKLDISEQLRDSRLVPSKTWTNHHVFCEVLRWVGRDQLLIRLHGYGDADPRGFSKRYRHSLKGTFRMEP